MSNRINGDFDPNSIEAFRAAYAAQILEPEDQETDPYTGLPTELVLNTSPWIQHTGLWKANDGTDKYFQPNQTLVPGDQSFDDEYEEEDEEISDEDLSALLASLDEELESEDDESELTDEELETLVEELLGSANSFDEDSDSDSLSEGEIESLLDELLSEGSSGDAPEEDHEDITEEEISDEEIDALIEELEAELENFQDEE